MEQMKKEETVRNAHLSRSEIYVVGAVGAVAVVVFASFIVNFWGRPIAAASGQWGEFGDYVGGILNPLVALAALFMLARSVQIQRKELSDARDALRGQAASAHASVEIAGYTAAINSVVAQIQIHQTNIEFLLSQANTGLIGVGVAGKAGRQLTKQDTYDEIAAVYRDIEELMKEREYFATRLKLALRAEGHSQL